MFIFFYIGNVGVNDEDIEIVNMVVDSGIWGVVLVILVIDLVNYRVVRYLDEWLKSCNMIGISGVDIWVLIVFIWENGVFNGVIVYVFDGKFDLDNLKIVVCNWFGLVGMDLVKEVFMVQFYIWLQKSWIWDIGYMDVDGGWFKVVVFDFGMKRNILCLLIDVGCDVIVLLVLSMVDEVLVYFFDGVFLLNGLGDLVVIGRYVVEII